LNKLQRFDTPTICNVIELFGVQPRESGFMDQRIRCAYPELSPMVGYAATAAFRSHQAPCAPSESASATSAYGSLDAQLEQFESLPGPAVVVFQDLDDPPVGATFGEVMCSTYRAFGSTGLITSGGGRDLAQVRALDYPVFTAGTICSHANCHMLHIGMPVRVGGLTIHTGDLLHGDANGVTRVPLAIAHEVADAAAEFMAAEALVLEYVQAGGTKTRQEFNARFAAMQEALAGLRRRVGRTAT
jgi:regulator of RNase E activity RraA